MKRLASRIALQAIQEQAVNDTELDSDAERKARKKGKVAAVRVSKKKGPQFSSLTLLPLELLQKVMTYLDLVDLGTLARLNEHWKLSGFLLKTTFRFEFPNLRGNLLPGLTLERLFNLVFVYQSCEYCKSEKAEINWIYQTRACSFCVHNKTCKAGSISKAVLSSLPKHKALYWRPAVEAALELFKNDHSKIKRLNMDSFWSALHNVKDWYSKYIDMRVNTTREDRKKRLLKGLEENIDDLDVSVVAELHEFRWAMNGYKTFENNKWRDEDDKSHIPLVINSYRRKLGELKALQVCKDKKKFIKDAYSEKFDGLGAYGFMELPQYLRICSEPEKVDSAHLASLLPILKIEQDSRTDLIARNQSLNRDALLLKNLKVSHAKRNARAFDLAEAKTRVEKLQVETRVVKWLSAKLLSLDPTIDTEMVKSLALFQLTVSKGVSAYYTSTEQIKQIQSEYANVLSLSARRPDELHAAYEHGVLPRYSDHHHCLVCDNSENYCFYSSLEVIGHLYEVHGVIPRPHFTEPALLL